MTIAKKILLSGLLACLLVIAALDVWGYLTLGTIEPAAAPVRERNANRVVMVFGASGSVGDGLLKAAMNDPDVEKIHVITRRTTPRIDAGVNSGRIELHLKENFTQYADLADVLGEVNAVLWGLGTSSLNVDDATYTRIHVDFPVAFVQEWLSARTAGPMSFHYVTGMGTGPEGSAHWAREKGRAEREITALAGSGDLRFFSYRSAFIRPASEGANAGHYILETLLRPGLLAITADDLGRAMLEIGARTGELPNGTLIDNADSIAYAGRYRASSP